MPCKRMAKQSKNARCIAKKRIAVFEKKYVKSVAKRKFVRFATLR